MREHLAAYFESHRKLVEAGALQRILDTAQPLDLSRRLIEAAGPSSPIVTLEMVESALRREHGGAVSVPPPGLRPTGGPPPAAGPPGTGPTSATAHPPPSFTLLAEGFIEPASTRPPLEAYEGLFASRYRALARMLRGRPELTGAVPVAELKRAERETAIIGMVGEVRQTAEKHHLILTVEDESGSVEVLVPRDSPAARQTYLPDEVVGLTLQLGRERARLPRVVSVHRPEIPVSRALGRAPRPTRALFLSDLHIGSRSFLTDAWGELIGFLRGEGPREGIARSIGHVVVAGDLVDGIGIYPNQERDLAIGDVFEQYAELARRLAELPPHLNVVVLPGNHDAVCPAEPQPALPAELARGLPPNVRAVGNPATFALDGVIVEAYHGRSFDDLIPALPGLTYARPTEVMKRMLAMRHLAPIYGGRTPLAPLARDGLVVDPAPDILVTGHAHTYGIDQYRGILLLNASTWQAETEYQRMRNISPVPAHAAVVALNDLSVETLDFEDGAPANGAAS